MENHIKEDNYLRAKKNVQKIKSFYIHLTVYIIINIMLALMNGWHGGIEGVQDSLKTTGFFWGIGLFFHWYSVFGKNIFFSKDWEERKIKEIMDNDIKKR